MASPISIKRTAIFAELRKFVWHLYTCGAGILLWKVTYFCIAYVAAAYCAAMLDEC